MPTPSPERRYEFSPDQNAIFSRLAGAMRFVAIVMVLASGTVGIAAVFIGRSTVVGAAMVAPLAIAVAFLAAQLYQAATHFRRIVSTRGSDVEHLMAALDEMANAYLTQRWLWIVAAVAILLALATTMAVGS